LGTRRASAHRLPEIHYYAAPKKKDGPKSLDEVDPELLKTYEKLGIPLKERAILAGVEGSNIAVDAVFDSVSVATTFRKTLSEAGVISARSPTRSASMRIWCANTSAASCRSRTTISRR